MARHGQPSVAQHSGRGGARERVHELLREFQVILDKVKATLKNSNSESNKHLLPELCFWNETKGMSTVTLLSKYR